MFYYPIQTLIKSLIFILMLASHTQLSTVIMEEGKPLAFYSQKLNPAQTHYTTME